MFARGAMCCQASWLAEVRNGFCQSLHGRSCHSVDCQLAEVCTYNGILLHLQHEDCESIRHEQACSIIKAQAAAVRLGDWCTDWRIVSCREMLKTCMGRQLDADVDVIVLQ